MYQLLEQCCSLCVGDEHYTEDSSVAEDIVSTIPLYRITYLFISLLIIVYWGRMHNNVVTLLPNKNRITSDVVLSRYA